MQEFRAKGYRIIAPPLPILLASENGQIVPSKYAIAARVAGLEIITWTLERSGRINEEVVPNKTSITRHSFRPSRRTRRCRTMEPSCPRPAGRDPRHLLRLGSDFGVYANCMNL